MPYLTDAGVDWTAASQETSTWTRELRSSEFGFGALGDEPFGGIVWTAVEKDS